MRIFLTTCSLFAAALAIQIILWKVRLPKSQMRTLLVIFALVFAVWLVGAAAFSIPFVDMLHIALFYVSTSLAYTITYSAIEADSPTLSLMRFVAQRNGVSADEVAYFFEQRPFMRARLAALVQSGLIRKDDGRYVLAGGGSLAFRLILGYRKVYGPIPKGG